MRICTACGEKNWIEVLNDKKIIVCCTCGRPIKQAPLNPQRATRDKKGNYYTTRTYLSDEEIG